MTTRNNVVWQDPPAITTPASLSAIAGSTRAAKILLARGIATPEQARAFLNPAHYRPSPPQDLPDLVPACDRLQQAIQQQQTILIWGDFDVDGQTATALLISGLEQLGAQTAYYIPHRLKESHGIQLDSLRDQIERHRPSILLTCDTGVTAFDATDYAKSQGVTVLITDHHDLSDRLPAADAVINPKRLTADHPLATLPGVGVAYKVIEYLYHQSGIPEQLVNLLDLVALGIVADVAEQTRDTRYLLQIGMERLRTTQRVGLRALFKVAGLLPKQLTALDIAFQLGPRLNAAGRLDDARPAVRLLTTHDPAEAEILAAQLEGLNRQRRHISRQITLAAQEAIARDPALLDWEGLVVAHRDWHPGILGIVASRLAEQYSRPVVLLSTADGIARGSARSAPGYDIGASIAAQADLLLQFGGHPGAAGLSLPEENIPAFRRRLSDTLHTTRDDGIKPVLQIDDVVLLSDITPALVDEINRLAPFGEGNPPVTLAVHDLTLKSVATIGRTQEHRRLTVIDAHGNQQPILWWNSADQPLPDGPFDLAFQVSFSTYQNSRSVQCAFVDYRRASSAPSRDQAPPRTIDDQRAVPDPQTALQEILARHPKAVIWAEGFRQAENPGMPLTGLSTGSPLVIYTAPALPNRLFRALEKTQARHVILIGADPPFVRLADFQRRLLQLIAYVLNQQAGQTTLEALAAATAQSYRTIQAALEYYQARGECGVDWSASPALTLTAESQPEPDTVDYWFERLKLNFYETLAYRAYFRRASAWRLLGWDEESS